MFFMNERLLLCCLSWKYFHTCLTLTLSSRFRFVSTYFTLPSFSKSIIFLIIGAIIPLFKYSKSQAIKPKSADVGFLTAFNTFNMVLMPSLPPV